MQITKTEEYGTINRTYDFISGTDGGKKRGRRHRLNKVNKKFLEDQEKAVTVLDIKKSLVEL